MSKLMKALKKSRFVFEMWKLNGLDGTDRSREVLKPEHEKAVSLLKKKHRKSQK